MNATNTINTKDTKDTSWYLRELTSNECLCGKEKKVGKSFCYLCFRALPAEMQKALYQRIYDGYEEAFEEAVKWLEENVW